MPRRHGAAHVVAWFEPPSGRAYGRTAPTASHTELLIKLSQLALLTLFLYPALTVVAETAATSSLVVPGIMTPAGQKFAGKCSDAAFADAADPAARSNRCERLLAQWRLEAARRSDAFTDTDTDNSEPGCLSLRGIPRYPYRL